MYFYWDRFLCAIPNACFISTLCAKGNFFCTFLLSKPTTSASQFLIWNVKINEQKAFLVPFLAKKRKRFYLEKYFQEYSVETWLFAIISFQCYKWINFLEGSALSMFSCLARVHFNVFIPTLSKYNWFFYQAHKLDLLAMFYY